MKHSLKILFFSLIVLAFATTSVKASDSDTTKHKYFGFGVRANTFTSTDFNLQNIPPAKILLNFDPIKYARIEFQYGFGNSTTERIVSTGSGNTKVSMANKTSIYTIGLFGMYRFEKTNFYLGMRFGKIKYSADDLNYSSMGVPSVITNTGDVRLIYGVLGGEHFLGKHFSVGGEFCMASLLDNFYPAAPSAQSTTATYKSTESSLIVRFYPF